MQDWAADTLKKIYNQLDAPPAPPIGSTSILTDCIFDVNNQLYTLMNDMELLASRLCGAFPVPEFNDQPPNDGIISQLLWSAGQQRLMIERINTACKKINDSL
jgi:hypothetical protein